MTVCAVRFVPRLFNCCGVDSVHQTPCLSRKHSGFKVARSSNAHSRSTQIGASSMTEPRILLPSIFIIAPNPKRIKLTHSTPHSSLHAKDERNDEYSLSDISKPTAEL